jgi:hypothetical protein
MSGEHISGALLRSGARWPGRPSWRASVRSCEPPARGWNAWFEQKLNATLADKENCVFIEVVGQFVGENNQKLRKDYEAKIATLETRLKDLEQQKSLEARFLELERRLDARQHDCSQGCRSPLTGNSLDQARIRDLAVRRSRLRGRSG